MDFFLTVIGLVLVLEGIPWFLSPPRAREMALRLAATPDVPLRFLGLTFMLVGLVLVYLGRTFF